MFTDCSSFYIIRINYILKFTPYQNSRIFLIRCLYQDLKFKFIVVRSFIITNFLFLGQNYLRLQFCSLKCPNYLGYKTT